MYSDYVGDDERERLNQAGELDVARNPEEAGNRQGEDGNWSVRSWIIEYMTFPQWAKEGQKAKELANKLAGKQGNAKAPMPQYLSRGKYQGKYVTAKYWGITMSQLKKEYEEWQNDEQWDINDTVLKFVHKFVKPKTGGTKMGYALWLNVDSPQEVTLMISHAWSESVDEFFKDVLNNTQENEVAFICFLSNYQGTEDEIDAQLGSDILNCPFTEVLHNPRCQRMLVVPNEALKSEGCGLYSRLWCDWEIKCAADRGLPIHFVKGKDELNYLFGQGEKMSSRHATCGSKKDQGLIQSAIMQDRAETRSFQAVSFGVVAAASAFGPIVGAVLFESWQAWALGFFIGPVVGFLLTGLAGPRMRSGMNREDGYGTLDGVIRAAAERKYSSRSFIWRLDMPEVIACMVLGGFLDVCGRWCLIQAGILEPEGFDGGLHIFVHFLEGLGSAFLLWMIFRPNKVGPWTNIFFRRKFDRVLLSLCFTVILATVYVVNKTLDKHLTNEDDDGKADCAGEACMLALIFLLALLSLCYENVWHCGGLIIVLGWMIATLCWNAALWRETLILLAGVAGIQLTPWKEEHRCIRLFFTICSVGAVGLLFAMPWIFQGYHDFWRCEHCLWGGYSCDIRIED